MQSFFIDLALWLPWIPLTYSFKNSLQSNILAPILSSFLFLSPRILRWFAIGKIGNLLDSKEENYSNSSEFKALLNLNGFIYLAILLLISTIIRLPVLDFILVALRGFIQAIFDSVRQSIIKSHFENSSSDQSTEFDNELKRKSFVLSLIPSLSMGLGSLIGGLISSYLSLNVIFGLSFIITLSVIFSVFGKGKVKLKFINFGLLFMKQKQTKAHETKFHSLNSSTMKRFAERFGLAAGFGGTPFLMHLKFDIIKGTEQFNFALYMCSISIAVLMAIILPKHIDWFSRVRLTWYYYFAAWVFQFLLLDTNDNSFSIIVFSILTVFFQFLFQGHSISQLVGSSSKVQLGYVFALASKFEIAGAIIAHLIYGVSLNNLSPKVAFEVSTIVSIAGAIFFSTNLCKKEFNLENNHGGQL